jgi:hypothetical protein
MKHEIEYHYNNSGLSDSNKIHQLHVFQRQLCSVFVKNACDIPSIVPCLVFHASPTHNFLSKFCSSSNVESISSNRERDGT